MEPMYHYEKLELAAELVSTTNDPKDLGLCPDCILAWCQKEFTETNKIPIITSLGHRRALLYGIAIGIALSEGQGKPEAL